MHTLKINATYLPEDLEEAGASISRKAREFNVSLVAIYIDEDGDIPVWEVYCEGEINRVEEFREWLKLDLLSK